MTITLTAAGFVLFCKGALMYLGILLLVLVGLRRLTDNTWVARIFTGVAVLIGVLAVCEYFMSDSTVGLGLGGYGHTVLDTIIIVFMCVVCRMLIQLRGEVAAIATPAPPI